ncbi:NepR family anti-sigma factor [Pseudoroseicyclus sp. CXY001]
MPEKHQKDDLEQMIDSNLRRVFQQEVERELPDRFVELLKQLKEQDSHP